jgi:GGDEF domain-containing protein
LPEKNIKDTVTQIYILKDEKLLSHTEAQSKNLMAQIFSRRLSLEEFMMPIYVKKWFDETEPSNEAFEEELHYFFLKLESLFYVSQLELVFMMSPKIKDFKLLNPEWKQNSQIIEKGGQKIRQITISKKNSLYHHGENILETFSTHGLTTRKGGRYWGTLTLNIPYDLTTSSFRMPEIKAMLNEVIVRFSRRASGNLMFIDKEDHLKRVKNKNKESQAAARISQLTKLENATAFNEVLMSIFMQDHIPKHSQYLTLTHLDGKALGLQNEALSHEVADQIIRKYGEIIVSKFQSTYHLSGDEFAIIDLTNDPKSFNEKMRTLFEVLSQTQIDLEITYREFAKMLVNTLLHSHKASRNDETIETYTADQLWQKVGLVMDESNPVVKKMKNDLKEIFKKLSHATPSQENILKEKEYLVHFTETQVRNGTNADQIIEAYVRPEHYQKIEAIKQSRKDLRLFVDEDKQGVLEQVGHRKIKISIKIGMTAGSYLIGPETFNEIKKYFDEADKSDVDLTQVFLNLRKKTIKKAEEVRSDARSRMNDQDTLVTP